MDRHRVISNIQDLRAARERRERPQREELIVSFHPLVYSLAAQYAETGHPYEELVELADLGLVRAAERYPLRGGTPFGPYAAAMIEREIDAHLLDRLRDPQAGRERLREAAAAQSLIRSLVARQEHLGELAEFLGLNSDVVAEGLMDAVLHDAVPLGLRPDDESSLEEDAGSPGHDTSELWRLFRGSLHLTSSAHHAA